VADDVVEDPVDVMPPPLADSFAAACTPFAPSPPDDCKEGTVDGGEYKEVVV